MQPLPLLLLEGEPVLLAHPVPLPLRRDVAVPVIQTDPLLLRVGEAVLLMHMLMLALRVGADVVEAQPDMDPETDAVTLLHKLTDGERVGVGTAEAVGAIELEDVAEGATVPEQVGWKARFSIWQDTGQVQGMGAVEPKGQ